MFAQAEAEEQELLIPIESYMPAASSSTAAGNEISQMETIDDSDIQVAGNGDTSMSTTIATVSKKNSFFNRISRPFKRKKLNSPNTSTTSSNITESDKLKLKSILENILHIKKSVDDIEKKFVKVSVSETEGEVVEDTITDQTTVDFKTRLLLISSAKSIDDILKHGHELRSNISQNIVYCSDCYEPGKSAGTFSYDFALGQDFSKKSVPREFINLKAHIGRHLTHKTHIENSKEKDIERKLQKSLTQRQYRVGMNLGRQAYKILKCGDSYLQYETDVSVLEAQGVDVGNLNHSRKFVKEFSKSVSKTLMTQVEKLTNEPLAATGRPSPISIIGDKITPNRRTMQIVGYQGYIGKKVQPLIAGVPALQGEDGRSVTSTLRDGLDSLKIPQKEQPSRIVGGAFDGEYFHLGVPQHLMNMMLVPEENRDWYSFQWDPAHILELAEADALNSAKCQPAKQVISTISDVSKSFSYGKSFRELLQEAALEFNNEEKDEGCLANTSSLRMPGHFSETRFATYSSAVIDKWLNNYSYYYKVMNKNKDDKLDKIDNAPFIFSCGGLRDTYSVLGNMSNAFQKSNIPSWEVSSIYETHINVFNKMEESLDPTNLSISSISDSTILPTLGAMAQEVSSSHEYQGCPLLNKLIPLQSTRSQMSRSDSLCNNVEDALQAAGKVVRPVIQNLIKNLNDRMTIEKDKNTILADAGTLFDISKIVKREPEEMPPSVIQSLQKYSDLAKNTGNLKHDIEFGDLIEEYKLFSRRVRDIAPQFVHKPNERKTSSVNPKIEYKDRYDQLDAYNKILETPELYKNIGNVTHLALTGICRTHCEAVVEGMGSVLTSHAEKRKKLKPESVEREGIIRWQGPHPGKQANKLIETSLDEHFNGRKNWHFVPTSEKANYFMSSAVLERTNKLAEKNQKVPFD